MARCKWIDATIWVDGDVFNPAGIGDENEWRQKFSGLFERYAYGRENAPETGRRHLQFRGVLKADLNNDITLTLNGYGFRNITPTHVRDFEYVYKDNDFYCSWEIWRPEFDYVKKNWSVWMEQLQSMEDEKGRCIEIIWDEKGNNAKTAFSMLMSYEHRAIYCPPFDKGRDLINFVLQARSADWYILDMPRAFEFTHDWACAVEQLKNGYVYDSRYSFKDKMLPRRPRVTLMVNELPDYEKYFSKDRVLPFRITPEGYLWSV